MNKWMKKLTAALCAAVLMCGMAVTAYAGGGEEWSGLDPVEPLPTETVDPGEGFTEDGNLVTRDLLYTPAGGHISVTIQTNHSGTSFRIENDSEPLSSEALSKVWDTFYRTDEARSGGGTGLGLAIAKSIVDLHGGKCSVRNTKSGVEFSFTIYR